MFFNFTKLMLANTMMIGVIMTICSNNWISMWMGLEMSLLSFMPLMQTDNQISSESMIKYFIIQSIASTLFLFSISIMMIGVNMMILNLISISMLIKLGAAPFHNWILMIIESMSLFSIFTLLTVLKLPPIFIMYQINSSTIIIPIMLGMLLSSLLCLNQSSIRKTLGYSSIYNMSLILSTVNFINISYSYMFIYSTILMFSMVLINKLKVNFINQMIINDFSMFMKISLWINMLSLSGFPLLLGFFNKIMIIQIMILNNQIILVSILMVSSMFVTMFYLRLAFNCILTLSSFKKWTNVETKTVFYPLLVNLFSMPFFSLISSIY
uniref:NADH-ubiquinone oxidoreductase chain 2 n=1 Tax=Cicadellidae sp. EMHAU-2015-Zz052706 TaxID=2037760 RepID=A0A2U7NV09_9HEMI|nr:NADH dehydrogenase subunit 2 [Cicadellidae sp. EMHAU-2015-Zz052706]